MNDDHCKPEDSPRSLSRELGLVGAIALGLGSIVGAGVFVSIGVAASVTGPAVILSLAIAACVAVCNGLNSAQLAANHPVSGGAYEYGYKYLNPWLGFIAGWTFLLAKSASAATAALGFAGYFLNIFGLSGQNLLVPTALIAVGVLTLIVLSGIRRSNQINIVIVSVTLLSLVFFVLAGLPLVFEAGLNNFTPFVQTNLSRSERPLQAILEATALMFVAYTGYGRIATLGEEVQEPRQTIPKAVILTLLLTMLLYMSVAIVGIGAVGVNIFGTATLQAVAPLEVAARQFYLPGSPIILAVGAITATLGVLLNLITGLSRVLFAMGRRGDMPRIVSRLRGNAAATTPAVAIIIMGIAIASLVLIGDVKVTWSFSAFSVLIYYAVTNLAALNLPPEGRLYPAWIAWVGLGACLFLAFWVESKIWLVGLALILVGLLWRLLRQILRGE